MMISSDVLSKAKESFEKIKKDISSNLELTQLDLLIFSEEQWKELIREQFSEHFEEYNGEIVTEFEDYVWYSVIEEVLINGEELGTSNEEAIRLIQKMKEEGKEFVCIGSESDNSKEMIGQTIHYKIEDKSTSISVSISFILNKPIYRKVKRD